MAATASLVSVEEYLRSTHDPDREYKSGVIESRPAADYDHSSWQTALICWFADRKEEWT